MKSIDSLLEIIDSAYKKTEELFNRLCEDERDSSAIVAECMEQFCELHLSDSTHIALEAYFRYLVDADKALSGIPFNFILREDERSQELENAFLQALSVITGNEQLVREIDERSLIDNYTDELTRLGDCTVYIIRCSEAKPMSPEDYTAWSAISELFERTPRIVKMLSCPDDVITSRFRLMDHIYYRVFRNMLTTCPLDAADILRILRKRLEERGFVWTESFDEAIAQYVQTVYPKADLREENFAEDLVERIVHEFYKMEREDKKLDENCIPYYKKDAAEAEPKPVSQPEPVPEKKAEPEPELNADELIDDYADKKPNINNLLIVSLSTFPKNFTKSRLKDYNAEYYQQQEPFLYKFADKLKDNGEILILATQQCLEQRRLHIGETGETIDASPLSYFANAARSMPGLENVVIKSFVVDDNNPAATVSQTVEHLRAVKKNNEKSASPTIFLGTNGGFRGNQLVLEAILSLLTSDGIRVAPQNVWGTKFEKSESELYECSAEFKIFDLVAGINEFMQYGKIDSLKRFVSANRDLSDQSVNDLMRYLDTVAESIQFCDVDGFEKGLDGLTDFYKNGGNKTNDPYIGIFFDNIRKNFGNLLVKPRRVLDEIIWCKDKGFFQQAFTLAEARWPLELINGYYKKVISLDEELVKRAFNMGKRFSEQKIYIELFNCTIANNQNRKDASKTWIIDTKCELVKDVVIIPVRGKAELTNDKRADTLRKVLEAQKKVKKDRNSISHANEIKPNVFINHLTAFIDITRDLYRVIGSDRPVLLSVAEEKESLQNRDNNTSKHTTEKKAEKEKHEIKQLDDSGKVFGNKLLESNTKKPYMKK